LENLNSIKLQPVFVKDSIYGHTCDKLEAFHYLRLKHSLLRHIP
jgi:hypothetical protein